MAGTRGDSVNPCPDSSANPDTSTRCAFSPSRRRRRATSPARWISPSATTPDGKPGHIALQSVTRVDARCRKKFAEKRIRKGPRLKTDGWSAYVDVAAAGFGHQPIVTGGGKKGVVPFRWMPAFICNMKRMIPGTYPNVKPKHMDRDLAEFEYRANRRLREARLFDRLRVAAVSVKALTCKQLVAGAS